MATTTETKKRAPIERTEHPHVIKSADTLGGEPRIDDTRMPVRQIFSLFEAGTSPKEIVVEFPWLSLAQVHDALSYAYDHLDEIRFHEDRHKIRNVMKKHDLVYVNSRLISHDRLTAGDVPPGAIVYTWETLPPELEE